MRILLVEDERRISTYVKRGLEESGYAVDAVYTGREALDWASGTPYDLIILDILLPEMDGLSVCRELRECGKRTPVLMLTARIPSTIVWPGWMPGRTITSSSLLP